MSTSAISNSNVSDSYTTVAATKEKDKNTSVNNNNAAASNTNSAASDVTSQDTATIETRSKKRLLPFMTRERFLQMTEKLLLHN